MNWESKSGRLFDARLQRRLNSYFDKVLEYYPNYRVENFYRDHRKLHERTPELRRLAGYGEFNEPFFSDFGFEYMNKNKIRDDNRESLENLLSRLKAKFPNGVKRVYELGDDIGAVYYYARIESLTPKDFLSRHELLNLDTLDIDHIVENLRARYPLGIRKVSALDQEDIYRLYKYAKKAGSTAKQVLRDNQLLMDLTEYQKQEFLASAELSTDLTVLLKYQTLKPLKELVIPAYIEAIGEKAFIGRNPINTITFEEGSKLRTIGKEAFYNTSFISRIDLSNASELEEIGPSAFGLCKRLTKLDIPDRVQKIGTNALEGCDSLRKVNIHHGSDVELLTAYGFDISDCCVISESKSFFDYSEYDRRAFMSYSNERLKISISRLTSPYGLSEEYREMYVRDVWSKIMKSQDLDLYLATENSILTKRNIDSFLLEANEYNFGEIVPYLLNYKLNYFGISESYSNFEIAVTEPATVVVMVQFVDRSRYIYNCEFDVDLGDKVYVSGMKEGMLGRVMGITDDQLNLMPYMQNVVTAVREIFD